MKLLSCLLGIALLCLGIGVAAIADDATTAPSQTEEHHTRARVLAPFNLLTDLSDDQKAKIAEIHGAELEQEHALRQKEHDDIMATLSDEQKKELDDVVARTAAERRAAAEERRAKTAEEHAQEAKEKADGMGATTQP
jgi:membrane protein involved in colicin uptake